MPVSGIVNVRYCAATPDHEGGTSTRGATARHNFQQKQIRGVLAQLFGTRSTSAKQQQHVSPSSAPVRAYFGSRGQSYAPEWRPDELTISASKKRPSVSGSRGGASLRASKRHASGALHVTSARSAPEGMLADFGALCFGTSAARPRGLHQQRARLRCAAVWASENTRATVTRLPPRVGTRSTRAACSSDQVRARAVKSNGEAVESHV